MEILKKYTKITKELLSIIRLHSSPDSIRRHGAYATEFIEQDATDVCPKLYYIQKNNDWTVHGLDKDFIKLLWYNKSPINLNDIELVNIFDIEYKDTFNYSIVDHTDNTICAVTDLTKIPNLEEIESILKISIKLSKEIIENNYDYKLSVWKNSIDGNSIGIIDYDDFVIDRIKYIDTFNFPISYFKLNGVMYSSFDDIYIEFTVGNKIKTIALHIVPQLIT